MSGYKVLQLSSDAITLPIHCDDVVAVVKQNEFFIGRRDPAKDKFGISHTGEIVLGSLQNQRWRGDFRQIRLHDSIEPIQIRQRLQEKNWITYSG